MEEQLKQQYADCQREMVECVLSDDKRRYFISGKQRALEELAAKCKVNLAPINIHSLTQKAVL